MIISVPLPRRALSRVAGITALLVSFLTVLVLLVVSDMLLVPVRQNHRGSPAGTAIGHLVRDACLKPPGRGQACWCGRQLLAVASSNASLCMPVPCSGA